MAKFNNAPQTGNDPNYMGFSREVDRPQNYRTPNRGLQSLFEGIGDTLTEGVTLVDENNKQDIKNQLYSGVDTVRKEMGVDVVTDAAGNKESLFKPDGTPQLPPGASNSKEEVQRLTAAYQNGQLNDSYYWGRINALTKQVRTQYPGYREEIDQTISHIVGTNPANALRSAIQSEYESSTKDAAAKANKFETFENQNLEYLPADYWQRKQDGKPYGELETKHIVAQKQASDYATKKEKADLELKASKNALSVEEAESSATFRVQQKLNEVLGEASRSLGNDVFQKIKEGKPLTPDEAQKFNAIAAKLTYQADAITNGILNEPFGNDPSRSYASVIKNDTKLKAIKENGTAFLKSTLELITNGQYGLANQNANLAKVMQDSDVARVMQSSEATRKVMAAQKLFGPAFNSYFSGPEGLATLNDAQQALRTLNMSENLTGESEGLKVQLDRLRDPKTKKVDPVSANGLIRDVTGVLTGQEFDVKAKTNYAMSAFGEKSLDFINQFQDKKTVYLKMLSPEMTKSMIELKGQSPEAFAAYSKWATTNLKTVFKSEADNVQKFITAGEGAAIAFDTNSNQFVVNVDPKFSIGSGAFAGPGIGVIQKMSPEKMFDMEHPGLRASIAGVNQMLKALEPIVEADTGKKPTETLISIITGIDPKSPKEQGMLQMLWEGFKNAIVPGAKADELPKDKQGAASDGKVQLAALELPDDDTANPIDEEVGAGLGNSDRNSRSSASLSEDAKGYENILNTIAGGEASSAGYDTVYGGWTGDTRPSHVSKMTVAGVQIAQRNGKSAGYDDVPIGRYQFVPKTLNRLIKKLDIDPATPFDAKLQDRLAVELLRERGYDDYKAGKISKEELLDNLAQEWAALQNSKGRAHYDHGGTVSARKILAAIDA